MNGEFTPLLLLNAFSVNQLAEFPAEVHFVRLSLGEARAMAGSGVDSAVGHPSTAEIFARQLGMEVPFNRSTVSLRPGDRALLGQYRGPRLPEGATELPEGASVEWFAVDIMKGAPQ